MRIRKGLLASVLAGAFFVILVAVAATTVIFEPGRIFKPPDGAISLKPFDIGDLLNFRLKVDQETCGKKVNSPQLDRIVERTSELRGLPLKKEVVFLECSEEAIRYQLMKEFRKESSPEELQADEDLLTALGLFPQNKDLEKLLIDVYTEQLAGAYDTETKAITIVAGKGTGSAMDELTTAHEVTHALQDQNFGLDEEPLESDSYDGDNSLGTLSLVEGDATLTIVLYGQRYSNVAQLLREQGEMEDSSEQLDRAPLYIRESLLFPYTEGLEFAQALYTSGGEDAIDTALENPPLSSEQILHPEKYLQKRENPREVKVPDIATSLGEGWQKTNEDCLGEFDINVWFEEFFPKAGRSEVGRGWGGNTIQYYDGPEEARVVVIDTVWDSADDAREFFDGYADLIERRFKGDVKKTADSQNAYVFEADGELFYCGIAGEATFCLQAPNRATLDKALANFPAFSLGAGT